MTGFILVLNHSWLCAVRSAQSSDSKLLRSPAALAKVWEAIDTGEGRGGACGSVCIWCRNVSLVRNARGSVSGFFLHGFYRHHFKDCLCLGVVLVVLFEAVAVHAVCVAFLFVFSTFILWHTVAVIVVFTAVTVHFVA